MARNDLVYLRRWFTTHTGSWDEAKVLSNVSGDFGNEIGALVEFFGLTPKVGQPKKSTGVTVMKDKKKKVIAKVIIKSFTFKEFKRVQGEDHPYHTPVFRFNIVVMAPKLGELQEGEAPEEVVYSGPLIVTFAEDYPRRYPFFVLPKNANFDTASHNHHMYPGGVMCLYRDFGSEETAWDEEHDNVAKAFGQAIPWIIWHERDRSRGVDADDVNRQ